MRILYIVTPIYDYLSATLIEGLNALGHDVVCTENSNYGKKVLDNRVIDYAESADLIIIGSNYAVRSYLVQGVKNPNKIAVDGSDSQKISVVNNIRFKAIFKRELNRKYSGYEDDYKFPLPFAAEHRYFNSILNPKDILVTFLANMDTNPLRFSIHQRLSNQKNPAIISGTTNERAYSTQSLQSVPVETPHYRSLLHRSLISVNVAGAGYDCSRFWEILAAGAMLFTQELDIVIPNGFTDGVDCVTFRSLDEFDEKLVFYLNRLDLVKEIAQRGHRRLLKYHTTRARAEYFLSRVSASIDRQDYCHEFLHPEIKAIESLCVGNGIDVGCGSSKTSPNCIGVDITAVGMERTVGCEAGRICVADVVASGDELGMFGSDSLDFVVARHNLGHCRDPHKTLLEWRRVLRRGGRLGVVVPDHDKIDTYALDPTHCCHFTQKSLADLVTRVGGFRLQKIDVCIPNWSLIGIFEKD